MGKRNRAKKKREREREKGKAQGKIAKEVNARIFCWAPGFPKRSKKKLRPGGSAEMRKNAYTVNSCFLKKLHSKFMLGARATGGPPRATFFGPETAF